MGLILILRDALHLRYRYNSADLPLQKVADFGIERGSETRGGATCPRYWQIGRDILDRQRRESWGAKVIDRLAADLKRAFPEMKGFSPRNRKYMRRSQRLTLGEDALMS